MLFKELLKLTDIDSVLRELKGINHNIDESAYKEIYKDLLSYDPILSNEGMTVFTELVKDIEGNEYIDVFGINKQNEKLSIVLVDWKEWLGYSVNMGSMSKAEFVAHCLYEMSFYGNEESVNNKRKELARESEKIKNKQYRTWVEVCIFCNGSGIKDNKKCICDNGKMKVYETY